MAMVLYNREATQFPAQFSSGETIQLAKMIASQRRAKRESKDSQFSRRRGILVEYFRRPAELLQLRGTKDEGRRAKEGSLVCDLNFLCRR